MSYPVHIRQIPTQAVATLRQHATLASLGQTMNATLSKIASSVEPSTSARGAPFALYHNEPFNPDDIDVEMGLPVAGDAKVSDAKGVHRRDLPGGAVAYTTHVGPYSSIGGAYAALFAWIAKHGHTRKGPPREIYLVGPGQAKSVAEYRTEIEVPID